MRDIRNMLEDLLRIGATSKPADPATPIFRKGLSTAANS
jgi:hypothetical protein